MTWIHYNDNQDDVVYRSSSTEVNDISIDLSTVVKKMIEKSEELPQEIDAVLFYIDATNGHIGVYWHNTKDPLEVGEEFTLEIPDLWDISLEHPDGSFYFDELTINAIKQFGKEGVKRGSTSYLTYYQTETDDPVKF